MAALVYLLEKIGDWPAIEGAISNFFAGRMPFGPEHSLTEAQKSTQMHLLGTMHFLQNPFKLEVQEALLSRLQTEYHSAATLLAGLLADLKHRELDAIEHHVLTQHKSYVYSLECQLREVRCEILRLEAPIYFASQDTEFRSGKPPPGMPGPVTVPITNDYKYWRHQLAIGVFSLTWIKNETDGSRYARADFVEHLSLKDVLSEAERGEISGIDEHAEVPTGRVSHSLGSLRVENLLFAGHGQHFHAEGYVHQ